MNDQTTPTHRDDPVHLTVSRVTVHSGGTSRLVVEIIDSSTRALPTTCRKPAHYRATAPKKVHAATGLHSLDCACDVECPKCEAPVGCSCSTPGGYHAKDHPQRIAISPRCQGLVDGTRTLCDLGEHEWTPSDAGDVETATQATCTRCARTEPIHAERLPFALGR